MKNEKFYTLSPTERTIYMLINKLQENGNTIDDIYLLLLNTHTNAVDRHRQIKLFNKITK